MNQKKRKKPNFYDKKKLNAVASKVVERRTQVEQPPAYGPGQDDVHLVGQIYVLRPKGMMPTWEQEGFRWHINLKSGDRDRVYHVTRESRPKVHYFFSGTGEDIVSETANKQEQGYQDGTKESFHDLPPDVQEFIMDNWNGIMGWT